MVGVALHRTASKSLTLLSVGFCVLTCFIATSSVNAAVTITIFNAGTTSSTYGTYYWALNGSLTTQAGNTSWLTPGGFLAAGATATPSPGTSVGFPASTNIIFGINNSSPPAFALQQQQILTSDSHGNVSGNLFFYINSASPPPCLTNLVFSVKNNTAQDLSYAAVDTTTLNSSGFYTSSTIGSPTVCPPGGVDVLTVSSIPCDTAGNWAVINWTGTAPVTNGEPIEGLLPVSGSLLLNQPVPSGNNGYTPPGNSSNPSDQSPGLILPGGTGQYNPTNPVVAGTNSPILFSSAPTNGTETAIQQGDSALYTAVVNAGNQANANAQTADAALAKIASATNGSGTNSSFTLTNYATATGQNIASNQASMLFNTTTNLFNAVTNGFESAQSALNYITNAMSGAAGNTFGQQMTNMWNTLPSTATNALDALAAATNADSLGGVNGFLSGFSPSVPGAPSGAPNMTITMQGMSLNFDPVVMFPNVSAFSLYGWEVVLSLAFLLECGRQFFSLVKARGNVQGGGIPDMTFVASALGFTLGGNFIGVAVAVLVPAVFVALFGGAMSVIFGFMSTYITAALSMSSWPTFMGDAYYLLCGFFPVTFFFTLLVTRITMYFTMSRVYAVASMAARWLFTK